MRSGFWISAAILLMPTLASAEVIGAYIGGTQRTDGGIVAGNTFFAVTPQTINALGFIDVGNDGILGSYQVGIWDSAQNLLASTVVTPSSPLINGFRYAPIPTLILPGGFQPFTIGALLPANPADAWIDDTSLVLGSGFAGAGFGRFQTSATLVFPTNVDSSSYAVVNATELSAAVPEPASLTLLGIGVIGLIGYHRRRMPA